MQIRILPDSLIDQIAAGEVVERPASVVKELVENALDGGASQIVIDVIDGGRTLISVIDDGCGMSRDNLANCIKRHATSKLADGNLLNINFMGFRGEALPSIASVSDMFIDTRELGAGDSGLVLNCSTGEIKPSAWESGTRVRVENLFAKTPARLKFLRSDRAEMMSVIEVVKRLAMARPDVGFTLNNKWRFPKGQPLIERIVSVMGDDVKGRMIEVDTNKLADSREQKQIAVSDKQIASEEFVLGIMPQTNSNIANCLSLSAICPPLSAICGALRLYGYISEPTLRRASGIDQYLFVNGRPVRDKVLVGALRAAYMDVMHAREFPLCALYLELPPAEVDVNVSPAKTEVHFLEPARIRGFIIRTLRDALAAPLMRHSDSAFGIQDNNFDDNASNAFIARERLCGVGAHSCAPSQRSCDNIIGRKATDGAQECAPTDSEFPLGRVIGQIGNKYILAENENGLLIIDQHAAHERIVYEKLRARKVQAAPLLLPVIIKMSPERVGAILEISNDLKNCGIVAEQFGEDAISIQEKPIDWELDWGTLLNKIADEVLAHGHSSGAQERLHLKLANYACHHSVRAGQKLSVESMNALLRDIERTERGGECNHGRPVWRQISTAELDGWFERI